MNEDSDNIQLAASKFYLIERSVVIKKVSKSFYWGTALLTCMKLKNLGTIL